MNSEVIELDLSLDPSIASENVVGLEGDRWRIEIGGNKTLIALHLKLTQSNGYEQSPVMPLTT